MKLGILADTHDHVDRIRRAVEALNRHRVELVLHAGDFVAPFAVNPLRDLQARVVAVLGNNDGERLGLAQRFAEVGELHPHLGVAEIGERRVAVVHYPELAEPLAASGRYHVVAYGHTHQVSLRHSGGLLINPGEVCGWVTGKATAAVVDLDSLEAQIVEL